MFAARLVVLLVLALAARTAAAQTRDAAWAAALAPGQTAMLPAGNYRGPWKLGPRVHLVASPGATLEGGDPVLTIAGDGVTLEGLAVRALPGAVGIRALGATGTELIDVHVTGGARNLSVKGGSISIRGGTFEHSSKFGLWLQGCHAAMSSLVVAHHLGPAIYLGHSSVDLSRATIVDAEYGLLAFGAQLDMQDSHVEQIGRAAVGAIVSAARIRRSEFTGPFSEAALSISGSHPIVLQGNHIRLTGRTGIKLINSIATMSDNDISGARSDAQGLEGDGLYSNNASVDSTGDRWSDNGGVSISIMGGSAVLRGCHIAGAGQAAAAVTSQGELRLSKCEISEGSMELMVAPDAQLTQEPAPGTPVH